MKKFMTDCQFMTIQQNFRVDCLCYSCINCHELFYQPGNIYSSGLTGLAQILTTLSTKIVGFNVPVSITLYLLNVPLFFIAWKKIGKKFTILLSLP